MGGIRKFIRSVAAFRDAHRNKWPGASVSPDAVVVGVIHDIKIGKGSVIEPGAVISTEYGGTISIGSGCQIMRGAMVMSYGGDIVIGDDSSVNPYSILYGHGGLSVGRYVRIAAHSIFIPANHTFDDPDVPIHHQPLSKRGITLGSDIWIGAGVRVLDGVCIGDGAVVGAGSVVTKDIEPYSINVGAPCRKVKMRAKI